MRAVRGLEAAPLVGARVREHGTAVRSLSAQRLQTEERLDRIRRLDRRVKHGPALAPKVPAVERVGLGRAGTGRESESPEGLEGILSEEGVFDRAARVRLAPRSLQAAACTTPINCDSEKLKKFYSDFLLGSPATSSLRRARS